MARMPAAMLSSQVAARQKALLIPLARAEARRDTDVPDIPRRCFGLRRSQAVSVVPGQRLPRARASSRPSCPPLRLPTSRTCKFRPCSGPLRVEPFLQLRLSPQEVEPTSTQPTAAQPAPPHTGSKLQQNSRSRRASIKSCSPPLPPKTRVVLCRPMHA